MARRPVALRVCPEAELGMVQYVAYEIRSSHNKYAIGTGGVHHNKTGKAPIPGTWYTFLVPDRGGKLKSSKTKLKKGLVVRSTFFTKGECFFDHFYRKGTSYSSYCLLLIRVVLVIVPRLLFLDCRQHAAVFVATTWYS